LQFLTVIF